MTEQLEIAKQISPEQLVSAIDDLLGRIGLQQRNGSVAAEYISPGPDYGIEIESRPFGRVARHPNKEGGSYYSVESIIPHNGGSTEVLSFKDERIFTVINTWVQIGEHDQERKSEEVELLPKEIETLYREVSDPSLEDRDQAIDSFYKQRHESRSRIGRLIAGILDTDKPRYF